MRAKWYTCTLFLIIFIAFGALQEQTNQPNQEIALEFVDVKIDENNINSAIADIKEKLITAGVENISITQTQKGALKIKYYSLLETSEIKKLFVNEWHVFSKNSSDNPLEIASTYHIDVYELTKNSDLSSTNNSFVLEFKLYSERSTPTNNLAFVKNTTNYKALHLFRTAYKAQKNSVFLKKHACYKEPEVRAGPKKFFL